MGSHGALFALTVNDDVSCLVIARKAATYLAQLLIVSLAEQKLGNYATAASNPLYENIGSTV